MGFILFIPIISSLFVLVSFATFLSSGRQVLNDGLFLLISIITVIFLPIFFLLVMDLGEKNDCCSDSAVFSPGNRVGIYILIALCMIAYFIAQFKQEILTPVAELLLNVFLVLALVINVVLCYHLHTKDADFFFWLFGNVPIIMLLLMQLSQRYTLIKIHIAENDLVVKGKAGKWAIKILQLNPFLQYPVLLVLLVPILLFLSLFLLLFGQKPDSIIKAFTDTYKHGFSQLDYMCDNVQCGGHFLCSVGANGHRQIVKPIRLGERNGGTIICTRQLLISNAFEELIQEKFPQLHRGIRRRYNKVGLFIHRYYKVFEIKVVSDTIYLLMKPLEWVFIVVLYTFDKMPENRIHKQYMSWEDRREIDERLFA